MLVPEVVLRLVVAPVLTVESDDVVPVVPDV